MPVTVRVLSWNVESLGDAKAVLPGTLKAPQASELINFINLVIRRLQADLVGIMELKSGQGENVKSWLVSKLNNVVGPVGYTWKGAVSTRQDGGTMEEYVVLWKDQAGRLQPDATAWPSPASLIGVIDDNAFSQVYASKGWTKLQDQNGFYAALSAAGYTTAGRFKLRTRQVTTGHPRLVPEEWDALSQMTPPQVTFTNTVPPPSPMTTVELQGLAKLLLDVDILRFTTYGDRSPFLANFVVGARTLAIVLLHAPGPQDKLRTDVINIIGLSRVARAAASSGNLLVMGDFNIAATQMNLTGRVYDRYTNRQGQFVFATVVPVRTAPVFAPITGAPLNAPDLLPNVKTSLVNTYLADNAPLNSVLGNTFDKFFFRSALNSMNYANQAVYNLVDVLNATSGNHDAALARSALTFFRSLRGAKFLNEQDNTLQTNFNKADNEVKRVTKKLTGINNQIAKTNPPPNSALYTRRNATQNEVNAATQKRAAYALQRVALGVMLALVNNAAANVPTGVGTALTTYRHGVSDHLPIVVELTA